MYGCVFNEIFCMSFMSLSILQFIINFTINCNLIFFL